MSVAMVAGTCKGLARRASPWLVGIRDRSRQANAWLTVCRKLCASATVWKILALRTRGFSLPKRPTRPLVLTWTSGGRQWIRI